ncbi:hypothetical protein N4G41_25185 [Kosakonia sacchari]|uniref:hypothetical protein n=1 Tax=Kosakonia sacchari TaxID=1158459 RepID=UPI002ACF0444|nr:hypothetical protein [Kosakonia sacchari]MDZ7324930.1 hypothetical protein [Kosakonia sacchari]
MPVPGGSGFSAIQQFPEVYHGEGGSKAAFYGTGHRVTKEGENTAYSVTGAGLPPQSGLWDRRTPEGRKQIRNSGFSDLRKNREEKEEAPYDNPAKNSIQILIMVYDAEIIYCIIICVLPVIALIVAVISSGEQNG